jgi:hypothetical protein
LEARLEREIEVLDVRHGGGFVVRLHVLGRVERSLYERANGYSYDAVKIFMPASLGFLRGI